MCIISSQGKQGVTVQTISSRCVRRVMISSIEHTRSRRCNADGHHSLAHLRASERALPTGASDVWVSHEADTYCAPVGEISPGRCALYHWSSSGMRGGHVVSHEVHA